MVSEVAQVNRSPRFVSEPQQAQPRTANTRSRQPRTKLMAAQLGQILRRCFGFVKIVGKGVTFEHKIPLFPPLHAPLILLVQPAFYYHGVTVQGLVVPCGRMRSVGNILSKVACQRKHQPRNTGKHKTARQVSDQHPSLSRYPPVGGRISLRESRKTSPAVRRAPSST